MLSHPLSYPHRYLRTFSIECGRMRVWSCLHSLFHSFWPGCRQIGQLKELIKLTTRICRTFGHFHLLYIFIIIFFFCSPGVCVLSSSSQFHFVSFCPSFCVILADMTWTVVYLLFLCASFFFWLLFILFISLTHANMFVCVCVCVCESGHALTHTHLYVL